MSAENGQSALNTDPPAYTLTTSAPPTTLKRTIEDTRALILANAIVIRQAPTLKVHGPVELVLGKTRPPRSCSSSRARSFVSTTSNVTIRINDAPEAAAGSSSSAAAEQRELGSNGVRENGKHYAALVCRSTQSPVGVAPILVGEPQASVEEALEWMLDQTEILVTDQLSRVGVNV